MLVQRKGGFHEQNRNCAGSYYEEREDERRQSAESYFFFPPLTPAVYCAHSHRIAMKEGQSLTLFSPAHPLQNSISAIIPSLNQEYLALHWTILATPYNA